MIRNRYRRILTFFARVILSLIFWELILPFLRLGRIVSQTRSRRLREIAARFRLLATEMGGVMIKVGQFLSTRVDVLPEEITNELANLQDEVDPEEFEDIRQVTEEEFGATLKELFPNFQEEPMAAASLGQVHQATTNVPFDGIDQVVVKVQRPNIEKIIATDLSALQTVGRWIKKYRPISKRADISALLREFANITYEEIDYLAEGKNAETFRSNFKNRAGVKVPKVIWTHTTKRVLTLENVQAIKITDYEAISSAGVSRKAVAQRLFETYLQQIFEDRFFHADPHPGNLFVEPFHNNLEMDLKKSGEQVEWSLNFVDFGMVGRVPPNIKSGLREMAIGVGTRDTTRLVNSYQKLDVLLPNANLDLIKEFDSKAFEYFYGKSMSELSQISWEEMHDFAKEFRELLLDMPFQLPENLLFLGRCIAILSGMCTGLDPEFNVWEGISPFAMKIIKEETVQGWDFWREEIGDWGKSLVNIPRRLNSALHMIESGDMSVDTPKLNYHAERLERTGRRLTSAIVFAVFFFSGVQLYLADEIYFGISLLTGSVIPLWRVIYPRR